MSSHLPDLTGESLARLRGLVSAMQAHNGEGVPFSDLVSLRRDLETRSGLTIDFDATRELGSPMVVVRMHGSSEIESTLSGLTERENEVARLVARGLRNAEIADQLCISVATVKDHVHSILRKTGLTSRTRIATAILGHSEE